MRIYQKPTVSIALFNNADIVAISGGGVAAGKFTQIKEGETNSIQLD